MEGLYPDTDLPEYCRSCCKTGGCDTCPRPQLLPECVPASEAYGVCMTQWRTGFSGATGLDYTACIATLRLYLPRWQAAAPAGDPVHQVTVETLLDDVRVIESAFLAAWSEKAANTTPPPSQDT